MFCFDLRAIKWSEIYPSVYEKFEVDPKKAITSADLSRIFR